MGEGKVLDGTWTGCKLTKVDIIQLFMSQSCYYLHYKKCFSKVPNYPILMEWLDNEPEDCPDDQDVWGSDMVKSSYNLEREEGSKVVKDKKKKKQVK